jgi:hypothetical protein
MTISLLSASLTAIGEIVVAYTVIKVHERIMKEHKIDAKVLKTMYKEQKLAILGVIMIASGWILYILDTTF